MVFLVIIAGGIVRMTQSGMGCPDWPKCFGKWIPPTNAGELPQNYESYLKQQDIDHTFNVFHTWTEYINRLLGALLGLFLLIQFAWGIKLFWKNNKKIVWISLGTLLLTGFQGWLGKRVVDANLATVKITTHMLVALLIAALALTIVQLQSVAASVAKKRLRNITFITLLLVVLQITLGTGVREQIDHISKELNYDSRNFWIAKLDAVFYIHRSFSILIAISCYYLYTNLKKYGIATTGSKLMLMSVFAEIILGAIMTYFSIPAVAQPLHLLFSSLLVVSIYSNLLTLTRAGYALHN